MRSQHHRGGGAEDYGEPVADRQPLASRAPQPADSAPAVQAEPVVAVPAPSVPPRPAATAAATPWVLSTYFAEGLPYSIVHQLSAQMFTFLGASLGAVGLTSLYGLAWNAKFVWSPLVDRFGTTRRWLVGAEIALAALVFALAVPAGRGDLNTVARLLVAVSVAAATHDIAVDGFYLHALDKGRQAALSGLRGAAYRAAMFCGNSLLVVLAGLTSWTLPFLVAGAVLLALAVGHAFALPEVERQAAAHRPRMREAFASFLRQPKVAVWLPFILTFKAGDALMFAMNAPFLKWLGQGAVGTGSLSGSGTLAHIVGTLVGGAVIARAGLRRTLVPIAAAQSVAILLYAALAAAHPGTSLIALVVVVEQLVAGFGTAAFLVFLMRRCQPEHKAAHFACASALMSVATTFAGSASGYLAKNLGFPSFFVLAFVVSIPGAVLAIFVPKEAAGDALA